MCCMCKNIPWANSIKEILVATLAWITLGGISVLDRIDRVSGLSITLCPTNETN